LRKKKTAEDESWKDWRMLADRGIRGCCWQEGLWIKRVENGMEELRELIVVPNIRIRNILEMAHKSCGNLGRKKVIPVVKTCFT